ncbi:MAG TPA: c-type cytochrome [Terriglobales bacterium]|nr:c-type cytochrome [Terriglobales bacterium]
MTRRQPLLSVMVFALALSVCGCARNPVSAARAPAPTAFGVAIVESSGGKQVAAVGTTFPQPLTVEVNDDSGNGVAGAAVTFSGPVGVRFDPPNGLTDSGGQFSTNVTLGAMAGRYQLVASTMSKAQKKIDVKVEEIALDYQRQLGQILDDKYCARCHNPESTPERVSNYDNLEVKPHPFTEGGTLNKLNDADLFAIIDHGGPALNKSALMPPYGFTLSKTEIQALIAYIRTISDPPYQASGMVYAR